MIPKYVKKTFMSWTESGHVWDKETRSYKPDTTRAIALCDGNWFAVAINAMRDGDMGEKDENGVYARRWVADELYTEDVQDVRPASIAEVNLYLKYWKPEDEQEPGEFIGIFYGNDKTEAVWKLKE